MKYISDFHKKNSQKKFAPVNGLILSLTRNFYYSKGHRKKPLPAHFRYLEKSLNLTVVIVQCTAHSHSWSFSFTRLWRRLQLKEGFNSSQAILYIQDVKHIDYDKM
jgi:hypothetical protein